jgi:CheY-like chemotaxis protein
MRELIQRAVGPAIRIDTELPDTPCVTLCDTNQLESAVLNLAINARDAMPQGGRLMIEVTQACIAPSFAKDNVSSSLGADYIVVSVTDTGIGMTPETAARAFDPFFTTKPLGRGTGLGLSMVYGFIKQSGGHVTIDSQPGRGTTVHLYLPHYRGAVETVERNDKPVSREALRADRAVNVLVVDDEPEVRSTVSEMLQELGYATAVAADGEECLRILQSSPTFDLLITDVGLTGDMDGWRLADRVREIRRDLKILFITGYTQTAALPMQSHARSGEILTKPFTMDTFAMKVRNIMASAQALHCSS